MYAHITYLRMYVCECVFACFSLASFLASFSPPPSLLFPSPPFPSFPLLCLAFACLHSSLPPSRPSFLASFLPSFLPSFLASLLPCFSASLPAFLPCFNVCFLLYVYYCSKQERDFLRKYFTNGAGKCVRPSVKTRLLSLKKESKEINIILKEEMKYPAPV